jgi:hypothetical protein
VHPETVSSSYKAQEEERDFQEGMKKFTKERELGRFSSKAKSQRSLRRSLQGVQKEFENCLSLER